MINVGIDVNKKTRVAAIKNPAAGILEQAEFSNTADGTRMAVVARTLAKVIWHVLADETEYRTQNKDLTERKYKMIECLVNTSD